MPPGLALSQPHRFGTRFAIYVAVTKQDKQMEVKDYIAQWEEVKEMTEGKTMDDIRTIFANDITNDLRVGKEPGIDHDIIDTNYKDILVTFVEKDGKARLHNWIEMYNDGGIFLGVIDVNSHRVLPPQV